MQIVSLSFRLAQDLICGRISDKPIRWQVGAESREKGLMIKR